MAHAHDAATRPHGHKGEMDDRRRAALEIRTVRDSFRAALWHGRASESADRADELLDAVAVRVHPERDPDLRRLFDEARAEVQQARQGSGA